MRTLTKVGLGIFLCLSVFMVMCSITRAAGTYYKGHLDYPWGIFWLQAEASIGVTMASITVYRSTLVGSNEVSDKFRLRLTKFFGKQSPNSNESSNDAGQQSTPSKGFALGRGRFPGATFTGLRTMFGLEKTTKTTTTESLASDIDLIETDYHKHIKKSASLTETGDASLSEYCP